MKTEAVATLRRKAANLVAALRADGVPVLLIEHGKPVAYLVSIESYECLNRRIAILEGIMLGEQALHDQRTLTTAQAKVKLRRWWM